MTLHGEVHVSPNGKVTIKPTPSGSSPRPRPWEWRVGCDCGECLGWVVVDAEDLRREKEMAARREAD